MTTKLMNLIALSFLLSACGGGSSSNVAATPAPTPTPTPAPSVFTGQFIDAPVQGLTFSTPSQSGLTNENGEFTYQQGEDVSFSIGGIAFPAIKAEVMLTPLDIFQTDDYYHIGVSNMLRLLQSLDVDGIAENGIEISTLTQQLASEYSIDFTAPDLATTIDPLLVDSGGVYQSLISEDQAIYHFQMTLEDMGNNSGNSCAKTHAKVGYTGSFSTLAHDVSGNATIVDDCTIVIENFTYDGGGPDVYVYAGIDHDYQSASAFAISGMLNGTIYDGDTLLLKLPSGKTLDDFNGLSIWCVDFNANFGQLEFTQ